MALSNYDSLALNEKGEPINGVITSPLGVTVEIYKNWLYIRDNKAWKKNGYFVKPTVMQINSGDITYQDLHILALRGPQGGIYVIVYYMDKEYNPHGMIGCGVCAYIDDKNHRTRFAGVTKKCLSWFKKELNKKQESWGSTSAWSKKKGRYVTTHDCTMVHVHYDIPDCFRKMSFRNALRFNQGDAFLMAGLGRKESPATPVGKQAKETVASTMMKTATFKRNLEKAFGP